jgi:GT2 family glycosyltransferase
MPSVSVGLVIYKTPTADLHELFELLAAEVNVNQIYIFDNGNDSELKQDVERRGWIYLTEGRNIGFGAGHNRIIGSLQNSAGDFHWIINPDLSWRESPLKSLTDYLNEHGNCAAVMPDIRNMDGSRQYLAKQLPSPLTLIGRRFLSSIGFMQRRIEVYEMRKQDYASPFQPPLISGCCFFARADALKEVSGFDERYFLYLEDYDLCRKLWRAGYSLAVQPLAQVNHGHGRASYRFGRAFVLHLIAACKYFTRWGWIWDGDARRRV